MKSEQIIVGLSAFGTFCFAIGANINPNSFGFKFSDLIGAIAAVFAAYFGAQAAFSMQERKSARDQLERNVANANRFLQSYYLYFNQVLQLKRDWSRDLDVLPPDAHFSFSAMLEIRYDEISNELKDLNFINSPDGFRVFNDLAIEINRFKSLIGIINERSLIMKRDVNPILAQNGLGHGVQIPLAALERMIGPDLNQMIKDLTGAGFNQINENIDSMLAAKSALIKRLKEIYPESEFMDFSMQ